MNVLVPELDIQKLEEINYTVLEAMREDKKIKVKFHKNKRYHEVTGLVEMKDDFMKVNGEKSPIEKIIDVKIIL